MRHFSALQTGLAFLPWTVTVGILSPGVTARLVSRFGAMRVLVLGMVTVILGLALLSTAGVHHSRALEAQHHGLAASLVSGYHLTFAIGAASVAIGIVTAVAALRTCQLPAGAESAGRPAPVHGLAPELESEIERQAA